jgi:hypothetical protein
MSAVSSIPYEPLAQAPRIAFLTGRSDPNRCALSPMQRALFDTLAADATGIRLDPLNFPWNLCEHAWRETPLLRASVANGRQYLAARRGDFADLPHDIVAHARDCLRTPSRTLLLVGSCGLSLLDALVAPFDDFERARVRIVAYGGVAPRWPNGIEGVQVRGRRDRIAGWFGPNQGPATRIVDCGHLDYLEHHAARDTVLDAARAQLPWLRGELRGDR